MPRNKVGRLKSNSFGTILEIVDEVDKETVIVRDKTNGVEIGECDYRDFIRGNIISPLDRQFDKVGFLGIGKYNEKDNKKEFKFFQQFIDRKLYVYNDELLDFQKFCDWYQDNYYEVDRIDNYGYKMMMKINAINKRLVFLPSDIDRLIEATKDMDKYVVCRSFSSYDEYKLYIPKINNTKSKVDTLYKYDEKEIEEIFISELQKYIRSLDDEFLVDMPTDVKELIINIKL